MGKMSNNAKFVSILTQDSAPKAPKKSHVCHLSAQHVYTMRLHHKIARYDFCWWVSKGRQEARRSGGWGSSGGALWTGEELDPRLILDVLGGEGPSGNPTPPTWDPTWPGHRPSLPPASDVVTWSFLNMLQWAWPAVRRAGEGGVPNSGNLKPRPQRLCSNPTAPCLRLQGYRAMRGPDLEPEQAQARLETASRPGQLCLAPILLDREPGLTG